MNRVMGGANLELVNRAIELKDSLATQKLLETVTEAVNSQVIDHWKRGYSLSGGWHGGDLTFQASRML